MQLVLQVQLLMKSLNSSQTILIDIIDASPVLTGATQEREINKLV